MSFVWPEALWGLALVPVVAALYVWLSRRRGGAAARYPGLAPAASGSLAWLRLRRALPPLLFLLALATLLFAVARPQAVITLPAYHDTVILAMDVSGSMRARDVKPSRLEAAQAAAKAFVADQPANTRIAVVSFAGTASLVQPATRNRNDVNAAIDRFQLQPGTALGTAIVLSLATLLPDAGIDVFEWIYGREKPRGVALGEVPAREGKPKPAPGSNSSGAIVLLSDGQRTAGADPIEAARFAASHGVRVYTVGVGTTKGEVLGAEGWSMRVRLDEESLKRIAEITHGEYFHAANAADLKKVYRNLSARITLEQKRSEVTALACAAAALLAALAGMLSLAWFNRIL